MIAPTPFPYDPIGIVRLVAGPTEGVVRWTGWAEVYIHPVRGKSVAFPRMDSIRDVRDPETKWLWVKRVGEMIG